MTKQKDLIAYAEEWVSYLLLKLSPKDFNEIKSIILFGSVARGDFDEKSDIDIFVDVADTALESKINKATESFLASKLKRRFELLGIKNEIHPNTGILKKWKGTRHSILMNGLLLYGKYLPDIKKSSLNAVLYWDSVQGNARIFLNRKLFGYCHSGKHYNGIVEKTGGEKLGPRCIIVPLGGYQKVRAVFRQMKIPVKMRSI